MLSISGKKFHLPEIWQIFFFFAGLFYYFLHFGLIFLSGRDKIDGTGPSYRGNTDNGGTCQDEQGFDQSCTAPDAGFFQGAAADWAVHHRPL
jgi:hypothetical protein